MRVVTAGGETIELGDVETTPTIGITDYSRRVTDDFGVTTVVERSFSRRMSVKLAVPFADVDLLQRRLAGLRATSALWVADDRFASLSVRGFYKYFDLDIATQPLSYCTLTVEGLAEAAAPADAGGDPAPAGLPSTLQLLQPVVMADSTLAASNVAENDAAEWAGATNYPVGARVMKAATHRIYESVAAANAGNDPAGASGKWLDVGPTNRWAMFDQALGTSTSAAAGSIVVTLDPGTAGAIALLDVVAGTVRVQANGYDRMLAAGAGAITFLDLPPTGQVTVTIAGPGTVSVGTLLIGRVVPLGITEASPTAGITDFSKKTIDDFGDVAIVERAWSKKMSAKALIRTDAIDVVANRIAGVRARPSLWIGQAGIDALTVYGFFKDFSIEVGETLSKLSLSIEGLSAAAKVQPLSSDVAWEDVKDTNPAKPKPADGATVGAPAGTPVGDLPADAVADALKILGAGSDSAAVLAGVQALLDRAETVATALLAAQIDSQDRLALLRRYTHMDGLPLGTTVLRETNSRIEGETRTTETFDLIGERSDNGQAFVLNGATVKISPTESFVERLQSIHADFTSPTGAVQAGLTSVVTAIAGPDGAIVRAVDTLDSKITGPDGEISAKVGSLREAITGPDGAIATAKDELETAIVGPGGAIESGIGSFRQTIVGPDGAIAQAIDTLDAKITGPNGTVEAGIDSLRQAIVGPDGAIAQAVDSLDAKITGPNGPISAGLETLSEAIVGPTGALTRFQQDLNVTLGDVSGDVSSLQQVTADINGKLKARFEQTAESGDGFVGIYGVVENDNGETTSNIAIVAEETGFWMRTPQGQLIRGMNLEFVNGQFRAAINGSLRADSVTADMLTDNSAVVPAYKRIIGPIAGTGYPGTIDYGGSTPGGGVKKFYEAPQ